MINPAPRGSRTLQAQNKILPGPVGAFISGSFINLTLGVWGGYHSKESLISVPGVLSYPVTRFGVQEGALFEMMTRYASLQYAA